MCAWGGSQGLGPPLGTVQQSSPPPLPLSRKHPPVLSLIARSRPAAQCLRAFSECVEDPSAVEKYRDSPALYNLLKKMINGGRR